MSEQKIRTFLSSIEKLSKAFNLPNESYMYDWELHVADPERLEEFIAYYSQLREPEDKDCLMKLILASLDQFLSDLVYNESEKLKIFDHHWSKTRRILIKDINIHAGLIQYWYQESACSYDEIFLLTPYIRGLDV